MFDQSPNGHFINDLIIFNSLSEGGYVSKGFIFEPPDLINAQVSDLNEFQDQLSLLLASLTESQRLQIQYYCDSDYRRELLRYQAETQKAGNVWTRRSRNERFTHYWQAMTERKLRRQRLVFYLSRKIETSASGLKTRWLRKSRNRRLNPRTTRRKKWFKRLKLRPKKRQSATAIKSSRRNRPKS